MTGAHIAGMPIVTEVARPLPKDRPLVRSLIRRLALPLAEQLLRVATTLSDTGVAVPTEKVIDAVPCPVCSVPLPTVQVYVAPATGPPAMLALTTLFAQADDGALIVAGGGALAVTVVGAEVPVQPFESVTVTL